MISEKTALQREAMMLFFLQNFGRIAFEKTNLCKTYAKMLNIKEKEVERTEGFLRKIGRKTITGI